MVSSGKVGTVSSSVGDSEGWRQAKVECLTKPHLTACICKVDQASSSNRRDPQGLNRR